jgi:hypothetical protein
MVDAKDKNRDTPYQERAEAEAGEAGCKAQQCFEDLMQEYTHQWPRRPEINFIMCLHE